jgi:hypothetical protein
MYWTSGSGRIELNITKKIAASCSHSGSCDNDVNLAMQLPTIKKQLAKIDPNTLANELKEYGAWDEIELQDHNANLTRILWIASGDITEGNF